MKLQTGERARGLFVLLWGREGGQTEPRSASNEPEIAQGTRTTRTHQGHARGNRMRDPLKHLEVTQLRCVGAHKKKWNARQDISQICHDFKSSQGSVGQSCSR